MNYKILSKIAEELNNEIPDISYLRGMVEALLSCMSEEISKTDKAFVADLPVNSFKTTTTVSDAGRSPNLLGIKDLIDKSVVTEN